MECVPFGSSFDPRSRDSVFDRKVENVVLLWQASQARNQHASNFQEAVLGQRQWYWHLVACEEHLENTSFLRGTGISIALPVIFRLASWATTSTSLDNAAALLLGVWEYLFPTRPMRLLYPPAGMTASLGHFHHHVTHWFRHSKAGEILRLAQIESRSKSRLKT